MSQSAGITLVEKRAQALFREDAGKGAFIPLKNYIRIIILCLPQKQNTPHKNVHLQSPFNHFVVVER